MNQTKSCQNCKQDFTIEPDDFTFYEKINVPPPTFCPDCRMQRRMTWRNDTSLYNRVCDLCGKNVVSMYHPDSGLTIYCNHCWNSDGWDPYAFGVDYDFSKPFFTQFRELMQKVPHMALANDNTVASVNCEYTGDLWFSKNCYMTFCGWRVENVFYSYLMNAGKEMFDCYAVLDTAEWMYEGLNSDKCYKAKYVEKCVSCTDSAFLYDCRNCSDCFMSAGLRNKRYYFKNEQLTKEEYEKVLAEYKLDTWDGAERARKEFAEFILKIPRRYAQIFKCFNASGDVLTNGKNARDCYYMDGPENCRYVQQSARPLDSYDLTTAGELSESYEGIVTDHSNRNLFGLFSVKSQYMEYTMHCPSAKYLFGCVGMKRGEYCIFNKRYTKEEYLELKEKIRQQMNDQPYVDALGNEYRYGEFFPTELSPFGYNETMAQEVFPLTKDVALARGYHFQDAIQKTTSKQTVERENIPQSIKDISDTFTNEILECETCLRNYKIHPEELRFYRAMAIPIPRRCFYCRHAMRIARRNPFKLWHRTCMNPKNPETGLACTNTFETSYAQNRQEIIFCEQCYQQEVS